MSKKINDAQKFAHLSNLDNVEQSEKKLRDQADTRSFKEYQKKSNRATSGRKPSGKGKVNMDSSIKQRDAEDSYVVGDMDMSGVEMTAD